MITALTLILVFLLLYAVKIAGAGGTKVLLPPEGQEWVKSYIYLPMLSVYLVLSVVSVPAVIYAITLGLTHRPAELARTNKAKVGRIAVYAWTTSLVLGVLTYIMLRIYPTTISRGALTLPHLF